jgi:hypothetical protein
MAELAESPPETVADRAEPATSEAPSGNLFREIRNYADLVAAVRARHDALNVSHLCLDGLIGLCGGYFSKLVAPDPPKKKLGAASLFDVLEGLGLRVVLFEDDEALARIASRLTCRAPRYSEPRAPRKKRRKKHRRRHNGNEHLQPPETASPPV